MQKRMIRYGFIPACVTTLCVFPVYATGWYIDDFLVFLFLPVSILFVGVPAFILVYKIFYDKPLLVTVISVLLFLLSFFMHQRDSYQNITINSKIAVMIVRILSLSMVTGMFFGIILHGTKTKKAGLPDSKDTVNEINDKLLMRPRPVTVFGVINIVSGVALIALMLHSHVRTSYVLYYLIMMISLLLLASGVALLKRFNYAVSLTAVAALVIFSCTVAEMLFQVSRLGVFVGLLLSVFYFVLFVYSVLLIVLVVLNKDVRLYFLK